MTSSLYICVLFFLVGNGLALPRVKRQEDSFARRNRVCGKIADLAFVIDSSRSIGEPEFNKELRFVREVLQEFELGPDKTRVAIVSFSNVVNTEFNFNQFSNENDILSAVSSIKYAAGPATVTYRALNQTRRGLFTPGVGDRPNVPNVVIVVTDGGTNPGRVDPYTKEMGKSLTLGEAEELKVMGCHVFSIGVGPHIDPSELMGIASKPEEKYYLQVDNFNKLNTRALTEMVAYRACEVQDPPPPQLCEASPTDIVFILDKSTSLRTMSNYMEELNFVTGVIDSLAIGRDHSQISVITFSTTSTFEFPLNRYQDSDSLKRAIMQLPWSKGDTYTNLALQDMLDKAFAPANGARSGVAKIGVIVTDGASTDPYKTEAMAERIHRARNINMFAIGVGDAFNKDELAMIASKPASKHVFEVKDVQALSSITGLFTGRFCKPVVRPTRRPTPAPIKDCQYRDLDVVFLLDKSTSLQTQTNFNKELVFVNDFLDEIDIDSGSAQVGVMTFSDDPKVEFFLNSYNTRFGVEQGLLGVKYTYGNTYTDRAIRTLVEDVLTQENGARPGVMKVIIIITDGKSTDPYSLADQTARLHRMSATVFAIGVGEAIDESELRMMATESDNVFRVDDLNALQNIRLQLASRVCGNDRNSIPFDRLRLGPRV
ncbi:cartilage matrix protein-like [Ylistrum balloti]|uniref:cartilage matrix protein-like n=1 Tax=Ylistrum balloti TaxID=509963 RepID=UPI0029058BFD|nr:cartilage matrix protein-like [Ylistrum balloti]XP_060079256.1 cartilage matrix protein-like [Ylistrum balloti]XP_060079257.1 cartilage matrix protein-like [Ylistrum balloti]